MDGPFLPTAQQETYQSAEKVLIYSKYDSPTPRNRICAMFALMNGRWEATSSLLSNLSTDEIESFLTPRKFCILQSIHANPLDNLYLKLNLSKNKDNPEERIVFTKHIHSLILDQNLHGLLPLLEDGRKWLDLTTNKLLTPGISFHNLDKEERLMIEHMIALYIILRKEGLPHHTICK